MSSKASTAATRARQVIGKIRPGSTSGRRSLPIRRTPDEIRGFWDEPGLREMILEGIPVRESELEIGAQDRDWGRTVTLRLELSAPVPGMTTQALTGKAVRRLKAVCETGELPTTAFNPSARDDAGEPAK
jgi:hypothetical protein